jgi:hypothetical protein
MAFCVAVAVIAAAVADPIVEFASNAGWFGPGVFTDHSNLDVVPALLAGVGLLALFMVRKARAILAGNAPANGVALMVPCIFALQIGTLYAMETAEQLIVWHHPLSSTVWLGGPLPISLAIHASFCFAVTCAIVRSRRSLASTTLRVIRLIHAIATIAANTQQAFAGRLDGDVCFTRFSPVLCATGERAPP